MNNEIKDLFLTQISEWVCDSYSLAISYFATPHDQEFSILDASLIVYPFPLVNPETFSLKAGSLLAGQIVFQSLPKREILKWIRAACNGELILPDIKLQLRIDSSLEFYSSSPHKETWFSELNLQASGAKLTPPPYLEIIQNEQALRCSQPPFDGMADIGAFLNLSDTRASGQAPRINIRVLPPVDMDFSKSSLVNNKFIFALVAHPKFNIDGLNLSLRESPGHGLSSRKQVSQDIKWAKDNKAKVSRGVVQVDLSNADSVLIMMNVGSRTVRRQWFIDPNKATNSRYVSTQLFDRDLKQLRNAVLESVDSVRFERGIASLLFLLGFSPSIQVETQAPDILIATIAGKLAIVECTTKISDFQSKLGKLVDRRNDLVKTLEASGHHLRVDAFLVCALPRAQIAVDESRLVHHQISLISKEDLQKAFDQLRTATDPDAWLDQAAASLEQRRRITG